MNIHWLQHVPFEGLGFIRSWAEKNDHSLVATRLWAEDQLPKPDDVRMLIIMGGPMGVNDLNFFPWLQEEKEFIARLVNRDRAILGICLGAQLLAEVLGADVYRNREKEIGWFPVKRAEAVPNSFKAMFPQETQVLHWHGDTFDIPPGGRLLASSEACINQAFGVGDKMLGLQYHLEMTSVGLSNIIAHCRDELVPGKWIQSEKEIIDKSDWVADSNAHLMRILEYFENLVEQ